MRRELHSSATAAFGLYGWSSEDPLSATMAVKSAELPYGPARKTQLLIPLQDIQQQDDAVLAVIGDEDRLELCERTFGNQHAIAGLEKRLDAEAGQARKTNLDARI